MSRTVVSTFFTKSDNSKLGDMTEEKIENLPAIQTRQAIQMDQPASTEDNTVGRFGNKRGKGKRLVIVRVTKDGRSRADSNQL